MKLDAIQQTFIESLLDDTRQAADRRLDIYRRNLKAHWLAALSSAYPVLKALTGDAYFTGLARAYAEVHPSRSGDLNEFGAHLAGFIAQRESHARYAYFGEIARLEWAIHQAWYARDPKPLSTQQWQQIDIAALLSNPLKTHPAASAMHSNHAVADIWRAHQPDGTLPERIDRPSWALVVRPEWRPFVIDQTEAAHEAFIALQNGRTLNEAIDTALRIDAAFDFGAQLQAWIAVNAITGPAT